MFKRINKRINKQIHKCTIPQMNIFTNVRFHKCTNAQTHRGIFPQMYIYLFITANLRFKSHFTKQNVHLFV